MGQDVADPARDRLRGYRLPIVLAVGLGGVLCSELLTYGLPAPSEAAAVSAPAAFLARLPPEPEAASAVDGEFRNAPAVIEPAPLASTAADSAVPEPIWAPAAIPDMPDVPLLPSPPDESVLLAALTPGMVSAPDAVVPPPQRPGPGLPPWRAHAVPFEHRPGQKLVAIIIDDAGPDRGRTARAIRLPGPLTISFLPYAGDLARQAAEARRRGHELMLHAPMEPLSPFEQPGPDALTTLMPRAELLRRMEINLARFDGYVGVNNHMGSRMTQSREAMEPVLELVRDRGLLFVDSRTTSSSLAGPLADRLGIPGAARDVFIDHDGSAAAVRARLADIERIARHAGRAVAIGHPHDVTLEALEQWLPGLADRGFTLAPISAVALSRQEAKH